MNIEYRKAEKSDAKVLVDIYNDSFYSDYIRYGECPAYGRTIEQMEQSIADFPKFLIICDNRPVGCISCKETEKGTYEVGCLCVIPEFQGQGIGKKLVEAVIKRIKDDMKPGYIVNLNLNSAKGKEPFYAKLGFVERPNEDAGAGMNQWLALEE